jgi:hypothetical protein
MTCPMIKFTANTDFDFDVPPSSLAVDDRTLVKRAAAGKLLKFEKTPGQTDLHLIALGSYEGTGYNRNGDAFLEDDCRKNHGFFKQAGRAVHRHHRNQPGDPKYGVIKASAYNEPMRRVELIVGLDNDKCADILAEQEKEGYTSWSMACVLEPDATVLTTRGQVPISEVVVDDLVMTHRGRWRPVSARTEHSFTGEVVQLFLNGLPEFPELTANHPLLVSVGAADKPEWMHVGHVRPGYWVRCLPVEGEVAVDDLRDLPPARQVVEVVIRRVVEQPVWNLEVEEDESYLLVRVVSHNSKQAYDLCSWCNHRARTDKDRCEHIPAKLGELREDGEMCGMINPNPRWFEISYVRRPADRIGMSLKLASDRRIRPLTERDYLNLYPGFTPPSDALLKVSVHAESKRRLLAKLSEMEKHVDAQADGRTGLSLFLRRKARLRESPRMSDGELDDLRRHPPRKTLRGLADRSILLRPEEFLRYLFGDRATGGLLDGLLSAVSGVFSRMRDRGCDEEVNDETFDPEPGGDLPDQLRKLLDRLTDGHSLSAGPASRRVIHISLTITPKDDGRPLRKLSSSVTPADDRLARAYATYKLAALRHLEDAGRLDLDLLWNAVLQQH